MARKVIGLNRGQTSDDAEIAASSTRALVVDIDLAASLTDAEIEFLLKQAMTRYRKDINNWSKT